MSTERKRAHSSSAPRQKSKLKERGKSKRLTKIERHAILLKTVKELGYDMDVFHLRWMPGEYLDRDTLESIPMFWFKKFGWYKPDVLKLYQAGQLNILKKRKRELIHVFGRGKKGNKSKQKDSGSLNATFYGASSSNRSSLESSVNKDDIYRRTRRLLKKVNAVPSKVRLVDNQSAMNITNAGFPDLSFISSQQIASIVSENEAKTPTNSNTDISGDYLQGISENAEQILTSTDNKTTITPIITNNTPLQHHKSSDSITTPFGDMDTNTLINLRAKHRRTSSLMKRTSSEFSMRNYASIVWNKLAILSGRGDTLTQRQFDIELQNNNILADPDICKQLFRSIQSENPINKKQINENDFYAVCLQLDKIPLLDEISTLPGNDNEDRKIWIVLKQVFVHIAQNEPFDVASYLTVKLSIEDLNNVDLVLKYISSRHNEWTTRLRILKWITANLETSVELRALTNDLNIGPFLLGWMCQCLDERSNLSKGALEMFPNILSIAMTHTGEAFQYLNDIFSSLFLVLRNKRSKDLTSTANECCIQCVDMIMDWHEHGELDNEVLLEICHIFRDNTNIKEQKHEKIRERCCAYFAFILYGINGANNDVIADEYKDEKEDDDEKKEAMHEASMSLFIPTDNITNNEQDKAWVPAPRASFVGQKNAFKISKVMKRKYLLDNEQFIKYMNEALNHGLNDKSADTRNTAFKLMDKLEKVEYDKKILGEVLKIDAFAMSKFKKWKERKNKKGRNGKRKKKSNRQRIKNHHLKKQGSVTLTIGAQ